eukprot:TRINITY_DN24204_c0_g2_i1.p1 TRINITY_DN24204_c0_g2~~TRINITY_DN24204_c0_g2_i1.p1  ORF type:complete len:508 (+),score=148.73 TRINITY_DN24204_c0_g2_i1:46-1569(+)
MGYSSWSKGGKGKGKEKGKGKGKSAKDGGFKCKGMGKGSGKGGKDKGKWVEVKPTVLVTGAAGFVAMSVIQALLRRGYKVRGTVRSVDPANDKVIMLKRKFRELELFEADLLAGAESFAKAVEGCKFVMHCASPFKLDAADFDKELIQPAVQGTDAVLRAAAKAGVQRVIVTSSVAAVGPPFDWYLDPSKADSEKVFDEADWTPDEPLDPVRGYRVSKVRAERKAWELSKELNLEVACINPSFVIGPMLSNRSDGESINMIKNMLDGTFKAKAEKRELKGFPRGVVDVRDVALAHVAAMEKKEAVGKRFLVTSEQAYTVLKMAGMFGARFEAYPLPTESQEKTFEPKYSTKSAKEVLGFKPRPVEVSLRNMAMAALSLGLCQKQFKLREAKAFGEVADLRPDSRGVYLLAAVVSVGEAQSEPFTEVVVGDASGIVTLSLTADEVKAIGAGTGQVVELRNGAVKMVKGYIRVIAGKWGKISKHDGDAAVTPNKAKDMSATEYELVKAA